MRFSAVRLVAGPLTIAACVVLAVAAGAVTGYMVYTRVRQNFLAEMRQEAENFLALTNSYVSTYSSILPQHAMADAPVPATFRARAGKAFNDSRSDADQFSAWMVGTATRWIGTPPQDEAMFDELRKMQQAISPQPLQAIIEAADGGHLMRNIFPSRATTSACVTCHNRLQPDLPTLEIGALLGAYVIDRDIDAALSGHRRLGASIGVLVTLVLLLGMWMYLQNKALQVQSGNLKRLADGDPLTGALNRRALRERCAALPDGVGFRVALLKIDIDHFKELNDVHGQEAADRVLKAFTDRAAEVLREQDMLVRIGGEEFLVVLPKATRATAYDIARRICLATARDTFDTGEAQIHMTVSIGVALPTASDKLDLDHWIKVADAQLDRAKAGGRNRVAMAYVA